MSILWSGFIILLVLIVRIGGRIRLWRLFVRLCRKVLLVPIAGLRLPLSGSELPVDGAKIGLSMLDSKSDLKDLIDDCERFKL